MSYFTGTVMENPNLIGDVTSLYRNTFHLKKVKQILERLESGGGDKKLGIWCFRSHLEL